MRPFKLLQRKVFGAQLLVIVIDKHQIEKKKKFPKQGEILICN